MADKIDHNKSDKKDDYTPLKAKFVESKKNGKLESNLKDDEKIKQQQEFEQYLKNKFKPQDSTCQSDKGVSKQNGLSEEVSNYQNLGQILDSSQGSDSKLRYCQEDNRQFYEIQPEFDQNNGQYHNQPTDYSHRKNFDQNFYQKNTIDPS